MRLENQCLRVDFDDASGGFTSIHDKRIGHEYVVAPDRALPWRAMVPTHQFPGAHIDAADAEFTQEQDALTIQWSLPEIDAQARFALEGHAITATLHLRNTSQSPIEEVIFPWLRGLGPTEGARIVWPHFLRRIIDDPFGKDLGGDHHTWNEWTQKTLGRYPENLATAWCDYGTQAHGICLEGRDPTFSITDFFLHKVVEKARNPVRRTLDIATSHPRRIRPGEEWQSAPVRIVVHDGDWHVAADEHREWLDTWIAKPDRPSKFAEAIGWHFYFMKHQDGYVVNTYDDLPRMAQAALDAGCPYLLVFGWQAGGHDNNYMYRYVPNEEWGGAAALEKALREVRDIGVEVMPFFNGTLANVEMPEHKEFGHRWEAKTRSGHAYYAGDWARHNFDAPSRNRAMLHAEMAPCAEHREYFLETVQRIVQEYGFGNTQLDQIAEKMFVDYDENHVETTPDRVYVDGLAALLPAVRNIVQTANPDGVVISESLNDFTGQWCDSSWDWTILFPHPEAILYSIPWVFGSHEIDALEFGEVNKAFAYKLHLDMKIDGGDAPISKYPEFAAHVKALAELRRRIAGYYVYADFRDQEGVTCSPPENVLVKVFLNPEAHKVGVVVAETGGKPAEVTIECESLEAASVRIDSSQRDAVEAGPHRSLHIDLQPHEVRVVCADLGDDA